MPAATQSVGRSLAPPDEQFWQRYSPHHEFPLSSVTSIALHALAVALLILLGWWLARLATEQHPALADVPVVVMPGGSQSGPNRDGADLGPLAPVERVEDIGPKRENEKPAVDPPRSSLGQPGVVPAAPLPLDAKADLGDLLKRSEQIQIDSRRITEENRAKLRQSLMPRQGDGRPGPGGRGGHGKDGGPGDGTGPGPDLGTAKERYERLGRWVMVFDTYSGDDYARQLAGLGAFLGVPRQDDDKVSYVIIRDLHARPASGKFEDLAEIGRIHWTDDKRESIAPLCSALGIRPVPDHVLAFFPAELERKLLRMELQYKGRRENQIEQTRFKVIKTAEGYEPKVIDQKQR